ncbi:hypothetical protein BH11ARM1_BH11ARM1_09770 [soil metagenome]
MNFIRVVAFVVTIAITHVIAFLISGIVMGAGLNFQSRLTPWLIPQTIFIIGVGIAALFIARAQKLNVLIVGAAVLVASHLAIASYYIKYGFFFQKFAITSWEWFVPGLLAATAAYLIPLESKPKPKSKPGRPLY